MTSILLIRHAQAAFGEGDYDRLCPRGIEQAKILGTHLAREGRPITTAISGTLRRHKETAAHALAAIGVGTPVAADPKFDEYSVDGLFESYLPLISEDIRAKYTSLRQDRKLFQTALIAVMNQWISGAGAAAGESWPKFQARVLAGLEEIVANSGKTDTLAVFTSAGVIAAAIGSVLGLTPTRVLDLHWRILNCSVSELHFGRTGFALIGFNTISHLRVAGDAELLTYR